MNYLVALISLLSFSAFSQSITYSLRMSKPQNHYFEVEMELKDFKQQELAVKMPVWTPGSYLIREFARNVNQVKAVDENGKSLTVTKTTKNEWKIAKGSSKTVRVRYEAYAFELSVRTSFLDLSHGFVSGSSVFFFVDGYQNIPGKLIIYPYESFKKVTTSLPAESESVQGDANVHRFSFKNYDELVDCPIEIGNHELFSFTVGNTRHQVALYGLANYDIEDLKTDMEKIVFAATDVFGENPNKEYTFIVHNVINGQGGLEHMNSCVLSVNRWTYSPSEYLNFLSLVAHEYFHLWNVKRIRPIELGPFNYDEENYTSLLWVMEGFTSYYDELLMVRAGYYSKSDYLNKLQGTLNYVEGAVGTRVQSLAHSSFDAWIKAYRPNENSGNTTMTYYSRGALIAALLDAKIIDKFNAKKCLDDFMRYLYTEFYKKKNRGFTEAEFQQALETFIGEDMDAFFNDYIYGTKMPDYNAYFSKIGLKAANTSKTTASFGATTAQEGGKTIVRSIRAGSSAEDAGISVGDEIIACNGLRINQQSLDNFISSLAVGEYIQLIVAREEIILELQAKITAYERQSFALEMMSPSSEKFYYWLRELN